MAPRTTRCTRTTGRRTTPTPIVGGGNPFGDATNAAWDMLSLDTAARSLHPGGVNVALADGSVRFVKNTVNVNVWRAVGTRNGGEVVSADAY